MSDIVERLRHWVGQVHGLLSEPERADSLMLAATAEIERLRLTDDEREDIACAESRLLSMANGPRDIQVAATLRGLLERMK